MSPDADGRAYDNNMEPVVWVVLLWTLFISSHVGLATARVRGPLVRRLGERGFLALFTAVASLVFIALVATYADTSDAGAPGIGLVAIPIARAILIAAVVAGVTLMVGAFAPRGYWDSPGAVLADRVRPAVGLERVTRHPFFAGTVLVMGAHMLLATRMSGTAFFAGFVVLAIAGPVHQARKLRTRRGAPYERYLAETSAIPFAAIIARRQRLVWSELPWGTLALGPVAAFGIHLVHADLLSWRGAPLSLAVVGGSVLIGLIMSRRTTG